MEAQATKDDIGIYTVIAMLDGTKLKSYHSARLLLEYSKAAIKKALEGNVATVELKDALKNIADHAKKIGDDASNSRYPGWDDLRHWTVQALEEAAPSMDKDFWRGVIKSFVQLERDTRSVLDKIQEETEKGMSALQTVFVVGGLIAVGSVIWNWLNRDTTVHASLLPPHVAVLPADTVHHD